MLLAGIGLARQSEKNGTAVSIGAFEPGALHLVETYDDLRSPSEIRAKLGRFPDLVGLAMDAPLIVWNSHGHRDCGRQVGKAYGSRKASCHTSNLARYPDPAGVRLSSHLAGAGSEHLGNSRGKWQLECYPHPAIIEIFGLPERLAYKKGRVAAKRPGQKELSKLILSLARSPILALDLSSDLRNRLKPDYIDSLKGRALKRNEDLLDSVVCLYVAGLYALSVNHTAYGDLQGGYIYVPQQRCV